MESSRNNNKLVFGVELEAHAQPMHSLITEVLTKQPQNTVDFMLQWVERRVEEEKLVLIPAFGSAVG